MASFSLELALTDHPWIRCDHWEGHEDDFYEYFDTQKSFELFLSEWCQKNGFSRVPKLLMVAGADLVAKCHLVSWYPQQNLGCICVERPGYTLPEIAGTHN